MSDPFADDSPPTIGFDPPPLREAVCSRERVEHNLEIIYLKYLEKSPRDRYPSAAELANDLERYLTGESIQARSLNMFDYLARALERSHLDVEFRNYGNVVLWFALIVGVFHLFKHWAITTEQPPYFVIVSHLLQFALMVVVLWRYRPRTLLPTSPAERQLWSVWIGYVLICLIVSLAMRTLYPGGREDYYNHYPIFSAITGMAYFVLGASYWGMFFILTCLMLFEPQWSVLAYGGLWTLVLLTIGLRLRKLGRERGAGE